MASVVVTHCGEKGGGGNHLTFTITTNKGVVTKCVDKDDFFKRPSVDELADMLLANFRIRAIKNGAISSDDIKTALNNVIFQEI